VLARNGHDWSPRYPLIVEAVNRLKARSCLVDGEAVACDANGVAVFQHLRRQPSGEHVFLFAFDLLELDGEDLRREPFETRKATLASLLRSQHTRGPILPSQGTRSTYASRNGISPLRAANCGSGTC
jgi:ATP-dependent DNA ligase